MAYTQGNLHAVTQTVPRLYMYAAPSGDNIAAVKADDYFLAETDSLRVGDMIMVADAANGAGAVLTVATNTGSAVTTAYLTNA